MSVTMLEKCNVKFVTHSFKEPRLSPVSWFCESQKQETSLSVGELLKLDFSRQICAAVDFSATYLHKNNMTNNPKKKKKIMTRINSANWKLFVLCTCISDLLLCDSGTNHNTTWKRYRGKDEKWCVSTLNLLVVLIIDYTLHYVIIYSIESND